MITVRHAQAHKSRALNPRRIARSLVTIFLLTLIQTVAPPVLAPKITTPESQAVTGTFTASSSTSRSYITIPAGVESITLTITGGGGGQGGVDGDKAGGKGGMAQRVVASFAVTPGDVVALFPGNAGSNGTSGANINSGGTGVGGAVSGGASTVTDSYWNVNGTSYQNPSFSGGGGGKVGALGGSGSGGGGGAASVVAINRNIVAIAGGAGGGGGAGNSTGAQGTDGVDANTPHSNLMYGGVGKDSGAGLNCSASDGGGGGGGGGGYYAGTGGSTELVGNECSGRGGFRGNALVYDALSSSVSSFNTSATPASPLNGSITYSYDVKSPSVCTPTSTIVDIYTVLKFDASINCTWTVPSTVSVIDIFAVGGGGGGGEDGGTGGGGGAGLSRSAVPVSANSSLTIRVGYGGRAGNFNAWSSDFGETSSVTTTSSTFNAPGGQGGGNRATGKGAGGSAAANGTFTGGAGGAYPSSGAVGGAGNFGISNYFYGSQNTYAGGGGGGCYFDTGSNVSGAIGRNGGGAGCSNTAASGQVNGIAGTAGTGGGGGGGGAGPAGRVMGGKGGSGVVLIRYATNAADSFPSSVSSALSARFSPGDLQVLDSARKGWIDSSGGGASIANANFIGSPYISTRGTTDGASQTDSTKTLLVAKGGTGDRITLRDLPTNYTFFSISRYVTGGSNGRLITASGSNWFSGHYNGTNGCAHHGAWLTGGECNTTNLYGWQLNTDQIKYYRQNGVDVSMNQDAGWGSQNYLYNQSYPTGFGINNDPYGQNSTWEVADFLVFNRQLTAGEIRAVENWLARINGLTLQKNYQSSETDTAVVMDGGNYFYGQYLNGMYINDTFTVEGWVNPNAYCDGNTECPIFSYESVLVTRIYQGTFWYALYGSSSGWQWTDTKVKFQSGEWHHFALSKRLTGNQANAVDLYRDGKVLYINRGTPYLNNAGNVAATNSSADVVNTNDTWFYLGARAGTPRYYGQMDEIKIWKVARTAAQITADLNSTETTSPNLQLYYDFNRDALSDTFDLQNLAWGGHSRSDMVSAGTQTFQDVKIVSTTTPYTTIKFPRNYLTQYGGWKVPQGISQVQVVLLGGGGGGGGGFEGGGGGAGGFIETLTTLTTGSTYSITVGTGGRGTAYPLIPTNGDSSAAFGETALGGGSGAVEFNDAGNNVQYAPGSGGSGGGGSWSVNFTGASGTTDQGNKGGNSSLLDETACGSGNTVFVGGGGGGATAAGQDASCLKGGNGGAGKASTVLGITVAAGGGGSVRPYTRTINSTFQGFGGTGGGGNSAYTNGAAVGATGGATNGTYGTGSGGGAGYAADGASGYAGNGGTGVVALRYITALKPSYTKPSNAYLNVGMTETFTTNVAVDSATVGLTRTFKWESTTPASSGTYTVLKTGTGATNAVYSWVPSDTSTSGSGYLYRLTVTDSDTAGLFITDSSTAFAVINRALVVTSTAASTSLAKKINVSRSETYTITLGTPTYRATLSPVIPGISIDTSTVGSVILRISDTASVGTWLETLTVTDSVSASVVIPLTISVSAPPTLLNTNEIVKNGLVFHLDAGNSESILLDDQATATGASWKDLSGRQNNAISGAGVNTGGYSSTGCTAPKYSSDNGGAVVFTGSTDNCLYASTITGREFDKSYTFEAWFKTSASLPAWAAVVSQGYTTGTQPISVTVGSLGGSQIFVAFYDGGGWRYANCGYTPTVGAWTHIAGTYNGTTMYTYINGSNIVNGSACSASLTNGFSATNNPNGMIIGKGHMGGTGSYTFPGSIGSVRLYNTPLTSAQILQNYNATKDRFTTSNLNLVKPSQKYGTLNIESFTVTSGGDTKTVTLGIGNRQGIQWDTSTTPGQVKLSVQESLTPGTYYDTITVTDEFSASTSLPIKFTVTKADTLTVYVETPTALSYTGSRANYTPVLKSLGAVGLESGTVLSSSINYKPAGTTCATGGYCRVGDIGPGGGIVFIDTSTVSSDGRIYEVAPQNWSGSDEISTVATYCSNNSSNLGATQVGIGWGETNTNLAKNSCLGGAVGKVNTFNSSNSTGYSDWFIPSKNEAIELAKISATAGLLNIGNNWTTGKWGYWASTEFSSSVMWSIGHTGASFNGNGNVSKSEASQNMVRPVRAFKSCWAVDTCAALSTTETPTAAGVYVITPISLTNSADILSKYSAITYSSSRVTINRVAQRAQVLPYLSTSYPETFTVNVMEGNGNGAVTFATTNGTASGCAFDYKKVYTTSQGTCSVTVVKAGDRNYLPDTVTANILFLTFVINQPSPAPGSGATIGLSGETPITRDPNAAPTISSLSTYTATAGSTQIVISGAGFNHLDLASITVKFWRNVTASGFTVNAGDSQITVTVPVGAITGKVTVTTPNGIAVSELPLTITP